MLLTFSFPPCADILTKQQSFNIYLLHVLRQSEQVNTGYMEDYNNHKRASLLQSCFVMAKHNDRMSILVNIVSKHITPFTRAPQLSLEQCQNLMNLLCCNGKARRPNVDPSYYCYQIHHAFYTTHTTAQSLTMQNSHESLCNQITDPTPGSQQVCPLWTCSILLLVHRVHE